MQRNQSSAPRGKGDGVNSVDKHRGADVGGKSDGRGRKEVLALKTRRVGGVEEMKVAENLPAIIKLKPNPM